MQFVDSKSGLADTVINIVQHIEKLFNNQIRRIALVSSSTIQ